MPSREIRWLERELPGLVENGVLSPETAERLRGHYAGRGTRSAALLLFGGIGALLIGSGVALLVAHNWDQLGRGERAGITLAILVFAQLAAGYTALRRFASVTWRESTVLFVMLMLAAAIALIGQTYHLPGDPRAFLGTCMLLSIPLVYLFEARAGALLYLVALAAWPLAGPVEAGDRALYLGYAALILPFLWLLHRRGGRAFLTSAVGTAAVLSLGSGMAGVVSVGSAEVAITVWTALAAALYGYGVAHEAQRAESGTELAARNLGAVVIAFAIGVLCFADSWSFVDENFGRDASPADVAAYATVSVLIGAAWALCMWRLSGPWYRRLAVGLPVVVALGIGMRVALDSGLPSALLLSVYGFALGIGALLSGLERESLRSANAGLLLLVTVIGVRFADADLSFVARGIAFILVGVGFLAVNMRLLRTRRLEET